MNVFNKQNSFTNFMLFAIAAMLANLIVSHSAGYATTYSDVVYCSGMFLLLVFIVLHKKGFERGAKVLATIFFNAFFFTFTQYYGLRTLVFVYYFPFLVSFIYMFRDSATKIEAKAFVYTSIATIIVTLAVCKMKGDEVLTEEQLVTMYKKNFTIAFALTAYYFYAIFSYLIEQKKLAEEASQSKARFLSMMSHELRTPLNGIIGTINLLNDTKNETEREKYHTVLTNSSQHLLHLVNNVLDYSKASAGKMQICPVSCSLFDIANNLHEVFKWRYSEKGLMLKANIDERLKRNFLIDDVRLVQVLTNLLSNSLKFTEKGSALLNMEVIEMSEENASVRIGVADTGKGLTKEQQQEIFQSFNTIRNKSRTVESSGLGLSISKMIVEMMGGELKINSEPDKGSEFYFVISIPFSKTQAKHVFTQTKEDVSLDGLKVLIAEDNPVNMMVARELLKKWNVHLIEAQNGLLAQEVLINRTDIDLVLLDLQMPVMSGYELIEWIRRSSKSLPVIAFTASMLQQEERDELYKLGFTSMISKPFAPEELKKTMKASLHKQPKHLLVVA